MTKTEHNAASKSHRMALAGMYRDFASEMLRDGLTTQCQRYHDMIYELRNTGGEKWSKIGKRLQWWKRVQFQSNKVN